MSGGCVRLDSLIVASTVLTSTADRADDSTITPDTLTHWQGIAQR